MWRTERTCSNDPFARAVIKAATSVSKYKHYLEFVSGNKNRVTYKHTGSDRSSNICIKCFAVIRKKK